MGLFDSFPLSNAYSVNLDWILSKMTELIKQIDSFTATNKLTFADPVEWSEDRNYNPNTIVLWNGDGYASKELVPVGILPTDERYWLKISDYNAQIHEIETEFEQLKTVVDSYKYAVNVRTFGAKGDGVTNDTVAVNSAIAEAGDKGAIYFPYGVYVLDSNWAPTEKIFADSGTKLVTPSGATHNAVKPITNDFNIVQGDVWTTDNNNYTPPSAANILQCREWKSTVNSSLVISGTLSTGSNRIHTSSPLDSVKPGYAVLCSAEGFPSGDDITSAIRVVSVGNGYIEIAADIGDGSGRPVAGWLWNGPTFSGDFTIRPRYWKCVEFMGVDTPIDNNPDCISWVANDVAVTRGQRVIAREVDVLLLDSPGKGISTGLLVAGQNNSGGAIVGVESNMSGAHNGGWAFSARNFNIGYYAPSCGTAFVFSPTWHNNETGASQPVFGGVVQENVLNYAAIAPSIAVQQIVNGSVAVESRRNSKEAAGFLYRGADETGNMLFGVDTTGRVTTPIVRIAKIPAAKTVQCTHVFEFEDASGRIWEVPCSLKA